MAPKHLVLLPGLDGTGELFVDFIAALPESWTATTVASPSDRFLSYTDLRPLVSTAVPQSERFVLVAESFSTPLAVWYAATNPQNLVAVIICAGFVRSPVRRWSGTVKALARPWLFRLKPPRTIVEYLLLGQNAPPDLLQKSAQDVTGLVFVPKVVRTSVAANIVANEEEVRGKLLAVLAPHSKDASVSPQPTAKRISPPSGCRFRTVSG